MTKMFFMTFKMKFDYRGREKRGQTRLFQTAYGREKSQSVPVFRDRRGW